MPPTRKHERDESSASTGSEKRARLNVSKGSASPVSAKASAGQAAFRAFAESLPEINKTFIHVEMPRRVLALQAILADYPPFVHVINVPQSPAAGQSLMPLANPLPPHTLLIERLLPLLHEETSTFLRSLSSIKVGIQLSLPAVEDNNFSSEIQEETISELSRYEDLHYNTLDRILGYHSNRSKVASKIVKYVGIVDYYHSIRELDENAHLDVRMTLTEIRNHYIILHDLLIKNEEKLKGELTKHHMTL